MGKNLTRIVTDLKLKVPCRNRNAGCTHKGVENEFQEHEDECGHRKVKCDFGCGDILFKDLLIHLKDTHKIDGVAKKWLMLNKFKPTRKDEPAGYSTAHMHEIGPEDGLMFATVARCDMHSGEGNGRKASCQEVPS